MSASAVHHQHGVGALGDNLRDFDEMGIHGRAVGAGCMSSATVAARAGQTAPKIQAHS